MAINNIHELKGDDEPTIEVGQPQHPRDDLRKLKEVRPEFITPRNRAERRLAQRQQRKRGR